MRRQILAFVLFNIRWIALEAAPPSPITVHIDCVAKKAEIPGTGSLCDCLQKALPRAIKNGQVLMGGETGDMDSGASTLQATLQSVLSYDQTPKLRASKIRSAQIPKLKAAEDYGDDDGQVEESSAEKLEKLQKGMSRLLRAINVFDKMDKYLSDRTRIIVKKIAQFYD